MRKQRLFTLCMTASVLTLSACSDLDLDLRDLGRGFDTTEAANAKSAARPKPDDRGIISYPNYQVAVARRGDTLSSLASRIGLPLAELARYNGVPQDASLNKGEVIALPTRVTEPSPATGALGTGPIKPAEPVDVQTLASNAITAAEPKPTRKPTVQTGAEPVRHQVSRGETAYSVARLYNVSARSLADWNGLDSDLSIREGQFLLIPVAAATAAARSDVPKPGDGSVTPTPPSAVKPLPAETPAPTTTASTTTPKVEDTPPSPNLAAEKTASSGTSQFARPADGKIIRDFKKGKNDGIDIAAPAGSPVRAAANGTVAAITKDTDQVPIIVVRHEGGLLTVYANVDGLKIKKGDRVKRGQTMAVVRAGSPAFVHFEVRKGLEALDPTPFLN